MDAFLSPPTQHEHAPNPDRIPVIKLHNHVKARAATSDEPSSSILFSALRTFPLHAAGELPRTDIILQTIRRQRATPSAVSGSGLPDHLKKTDRGEDFLLYQDKELIMFTTKSNLTVLKQSKHWFADGTFKASDQLRGVTLLIIFIQVCPKDFYQLFTLHALMAGTAVPLVYALLIGKKTDDYNIFFEKVFEQDNFNPESILTDFEAGSLKSVRDMLPNILHKGKILIDRSYP
jgi:hypothetical protein